MQTLFWTISIIGMAYFLLAKRRFDWFSVAFFSACVYFLPGFFGFTSYLTLGGWPESPIHPGAYGIMIAVESAVLAGAVISDMLPFKRTTTTEGRDDVRQGDGYLVSILLFLALLGLSLMFLTTGAALFELDKLTMMEELNRWHILFYTATMLGCTLAFAFRKWFAFACFCLLVLFDVFIGYRITPAIAGISIFTLWLSRQGPKRLLVSYWRPLLAGGLLAASLFFLKEVQYAIKYADIDLLRSIVTNPSTYSSMFLNSEPFICQSTLNEVVTQNYAVGMDHLKGAIYQFILFAPEMGLQATSFHEMFQPDLFPETMFYGMGNNIWAEMWSAGGWPLLSVFLLVFVSGLKLFSVLTASGNLKWRGFAAVLAAYWAFYIHRNDISYQLALEKRVLLVMGIAVLAALLLLKLKSLLAACSGASRMGKARAALIALAASVSISSFSAANALAAAVYDSGSFTDLPAAVSAIGGTDAVLSMNRRNTLKKDLSVPANITLQFLEGGSLYLEQGVTVTIEAPLLAPKARIFEGPGSVVLERAEAYPQWWGARGDGVNDDGYAVQAAIDSLHAGGGGTVRLPVGTYLLNHITGLYYALRSRDRVSVIGEGETSILRAGDNLRTSSRGVAILYNHEDPVTRCRFAQFVVDYNGKKNLRLASWGSTGVNAIVSEISRMGAEHASNVTIENIHFRDVTGAHCVWFGNYPDNLDNIVRNCRVTNVGQSVPGNQVSDHSSIYMGGTRGQVTGNAFYNQAPCNVSTAIEIHSSDTVVSNNIVTNYATAVNIGGEANNCSRVVLSGNNFRNCRNGIVLWHYSPFILSDITITRNMISLRDTDGAAFPPAMGIIYGNGYVTSRTNMSGLTIADNTIYQEAMTPSDTRPNTAIDIEGADNVVIRNNTIYNMNGEAVYLQSRSAEQGMGRITVSGNSIRNVGRTPFADRKRAIVFNAYQDAKGGMNDILVQNNTITAGDNAPMKHGIVFNSGAFRSVQMSGNSITRTTSSAIQIQTTDTSGFQVQ